MEQAKKEIRLIFGTILIIGGIIAIVCGLYFQHWVMTPLLILAGVDMISTVVWKPIFKQGPLSKLAYGDIEAGVNKQQYIEDTIDKEVEISLGFGLEIKPEDVELEKSVISELIIYYWSDILNGDYNKTVLLINESVTKELQDQIEYYFKNTPDGEVKTRYNCHLSSAVSRMCMDITNYLV